MPFKKGHKLSKGKGRPVGTRDWAVELEESIKKAEGKNKRSLMDAYVDMAYRDPKVMVSLMKKLLADRTETEHSGGISGDFIIGFKGSANGFIEPRSETVTATTIGEQVKEVSSSSAS